MIFICLFYENMINTDSLLKSPGNVYNSIDADIQSEQKLVRLTQRNVELMIVAFMDQTI